MEPIIKSAQKEARDILANVHAIANCSHIDTLITTTAHSVAEAVRKDAENTVDRVRIILALVEIVKLKADQGGYTFAILDAETRAEVLKLETDLKKAISPTQEK